MTPVVTDGPAVAVTAAQAKATGIFSADDSDAYVNLLLEVAQAHIDGPDGWLGRAIGLQTLEITAPASCTIDTAKLPLPPYVDTVSDVVDGATRTFKWRAGYGSSPAKPLPAAIRHAIILMAGALKDAVPDEGGTIKRDTVEGVGSQEFTIPDGASDTMKSAARSLLDLYKVWYV